MRRLALLLALVGCQGGITITPTRGARTAVLVIVDDTAPAQGAELELHDGRERDGGHSVPQGGRLRYDCAVTALATSHEKTLDLLGARPVSLSARRT